VAPSVLRWTEKQSLGAVAVPSGCSIGAAAVRSRRHRSIAAPVRPLSPQFIGAVAVRLYNHSLCTPWKAGAERSHPASEAQRPRRAGGSPFSQNRPPAFGLARSRRTKSGRAPRPRQPGQHPPTPLALPARNGGLLRVSMQASSVPYNLSVGRLRACARTGGKIPCGRTQVLPGIGSYKPIEGESDVPDFVRTARREWKLMSYLEGAMDGSEPT